MRCKYTILIRAKLIMSTITSKSPMMIPFISSMCQYLKFLEKNFRVKYNSLIRNDDYYRQS